MLRRGIKRVAGRQTDIAIPLRSILLIEPGRGIMPVANHVAANRMPHGPKLGNRIRSEFWLRPLRGEIRRARRRVRR